MDNFMIYQQMEENFDMMTYYEYLYEESHKEDQIKEKTFKEVRA